MCDGVVAEDLEDAEGGTEWQAENREDTEGPLIC